MSSSAGSGHQPSQSRAIPTRTVPISDAAQLPHDYCTTPGGTLFSTTPGGERPPTPRTLRPTAPGACSPLPPPCLPSLPPRSFNSGRVRAGPLAGANWPDPTCPAPPKPRGTAFGNLNFAFSRARSSIERAPTLETWLFFAKQKEKQSPCSRVVALDLVFSDSSRADSPALGLARVPHRLCLLRVVHLCTFTLGFGAVC